METKELQERLARIGMDPGPVDGLDGPATRTAVARFQLACALPGHHLVVDAAAGPRTWAALREASDAGRLSAHFSVAELRTRTRAGGPKDGTCWVHRDLLNRLEALRSQVGRPLGVVSGWRDPAHNARVGGARSSQHTFGDAPELRSISSRLSRSAELTVGKAADLNRNYIRLEECKSLALFGGLGYREVAGVKWVTHVDVRPVDPRRPTTWRYG
jgi:hypothetical protein